MKSMSHILAVRVCLGLAEFGCVCKSFPESLRVVMSERNNILSIFFVFLLGFISDKSIKVDYYGCSYIRVNCNL